MGATLAQIREGLAANLATIADIQISPYVLSNPTPPAAEIEPAPVEYDQAFGRGHDRWTMTVRVFVGLTTDIGAQKRLDLYLAPSGATSVKTALESDCTLGGTVQDLHVTGCSGYRVFGRQGQAPVLGAEWQLTVIT
jgi:hypothetical protein